MLESISSVLWLPDCVVSAPPYKPPRFYIGFPKPQLAALLCGMLFPWEGAQVSSYSASVKVIHDRNRG